MTQAQVLTPAQALVAQLFGYAPEDVALLEEEMFVQLIGSYEETLLYEAGNAGYDVSGVYLTDTEALSNLRQRARFASQSVARTYNSDLLDEIGEIAEDVPTANRNVYAARLETWDRTRMQAKALDIAVNEMGYAMQQSRRDFAAKNPEMTGQARVMPLSARCPLCQELVSLGDMPLASALQLPLPRHVNCVHWLEIAWACDLATHKAWTVAIVKAECPPLEELWLGGESEEYTLRTGRIENVAEWHEESMNKVYSGTINGQQVIIKPVQQPSGPWVFDAIPRGTEHLRDQASHLVARNLPEGYLNVPTLVARNVEGLGEATVQRFVPNADAYVSIGGYLSPQARNAALFDAVIGNTDRHGGNWLVDDKMQLHLIDHGLTFPTKATKYWHNEPLDMFGGSDLTQEEYQALKQLKQHWPREIEGLVGKEAADQALGRVDYMLDNLEMWKHVKP